MLGCDRFVEQIANDVNATEYLTKDVECLEQLYDKFADIINGFGKEAQINIDLTEYLTISSFTYKINKKLLEMRDEQLARDVYDNEIPQ